MKTEFVGKIFRQGKSLLIVIPKYLAEYHKLKAGNLVKLKIVDKADKR